MDAARGSDALESEKIPRSAPPLRRVLGAFGVDVLLAIVIGLALMMGGGIAWGVIEGIRLAATGAAPEAITASLQAPGAIVQLILALFGMGGVAIVLYVWRRPATRDERAQSRAAAFRGSTWLIVVMAGVGIFLFSSALSWLGHVLGIPPNPSNLLLLREALSSHAWFVALFAVVLAPVYEELLFRRVLFGRLWQAGHPLLGMVLSGVAFALAHELPGTGGNSAGATVLLLSVYAAMGMAFAWVYRRTGTLWAPIATHALNNAFALALLQLSGN